MQPKWSKNRTYYPTSISWLFKTTVCKSWWCPRSVYLRWWGYLLFLGCLRPEEATVHNSGVGSRMNEWSTSSFATNKETSKISQWVLRYTHASSHTIRTLAWSFSFLTPGRANYRLPTVGGSNSKKDSDNLMSHFKRRSYFLLFIFTHQS